MQGVSNKHCLLSFFIVPTTGVFVARGKEDALVTLNMVPGESVYDEKRISVDVSPNKKYLW